MTDPEQKASEIKRFRKSDAGKALIAWVHSEYGRAKTGRSRTQLQWHKNMAMYSGQQNLAFTSEKTAEGFANKLVAPRAPYYKMPKTINRTRGIVRTEMAKLLSQRPTTVVVPASADDEDLRMALAAEQVNESYVNKRHLLNHMERAVWWASVTGNGFLKTWWDQSLPDKDSGDMGDIRYGSVTPFHLFVPDLREVDIEDQPFVINVQTKPVEWCKNAFGALLEDDVSDKFQPSTTGENDILEAGYLNLDNKEKPDSCIIYEVWIKPGATNHLPNGGLLTLVDDILVSFTENGLPYAHGMYPFTKIESIPSAKFYADSTLNDTNGLQQEYNELRTAIHHAGKLMAKPQLMAERGTVIVSKMTNEPGAVIEYKPGRQAPTPLPLTPLPQYYVDQQDRILSDMEDVSGQHQVSKGSAPSGLTAGTAITALQERDDAYLTTTFNSVERAYEKIGQQTIGLFVEYVDIPRAIKVGGAEASFDTLLLKGGDLQNSTDFRVESGSAVGQSKAAKEAYVMDLFKLGALDRDEMLELISVGGVQKVTDRLKVAERQAQRENIKMKKLDPAQIQQAAEEFEMAAGDPMSPIGVNMAPDPLAPVDEMAQQQKPMRAGPIVKVNNWDNHAIHIATHNAFRMGQEFEMLPDEVKEEFELHVQLHNQMLAADMQMDQQAAMMQQGGDPAAAGEQAPPGATMAGNGNVPDVAPSQDEG